MNDIYPRESRKLRDRLINCLDACFDSNNYDRYVPPSILTEVRAIRQKRTRDQPELGITWTNQRPAARIRGRRPANQILAHDAGQVVGDAQRCTNEVQAFKLFMSQDIFDLMILNTNNKINFYNETFPDKKVDLVDSTEIHALFGIFMARGFFQWNYCDIKGLWNLPQSNPLFTATMSRKRFTQLLKFLSMDDPETRRDRFQYDRLAAARQCFEMFNDNCGTHLKAGPYLTIDECLYSCRNSWSGKTFNPSKPSKYTHRHIKSTFFTIEL